MDVMTIIGTYLKQHGYDGLFNVEDDFCFCQIDEGIAGECGGVWADCYAGHAVPVEGGFQWQDGPRPNFKKEK